VVCLGSRCAMNPNSKRLIAVYEDGQTPSAWLRLTSVLMLCYATINSFRAPSRTRFGIIEKFRSLAGFSDEFKRCSAERQEQLVKQRL
jgi:hypothetical protein